MGDANDSGFRYGRVHIEDIFNLCGIDILASADDHILFPIHDIKVSILIHVSHIACVKPAPLDGLFRLLWIFPITLENSITLHNNLPHFIRRKISSLIIYDPGMDMLRFHSTGTQPLHLFFCFLKDMVFSWKMGDLRASLRHPEELNK